MGEVASGRPEVGEEIAAALRVVTPERVEWYGSAMLSAAAGEPRRVGSNIHTDEEYARSEGLAAVIADGMITANWLSSMLVARFGIDYIAHGRLRTKFIRPVFLGAAVITRGVVRSVEILGGGRALVSLGVWCEDESGAKLTDGDASVELGPA